jgi:antiviral defense system Shedu protein SduA
MQLYLRHNPWVLYWTLCSAGGHSRYVLPGFPLGARYKTDFALVNSYSGAFEVFFVELEPPGDCAFTRAGNPSKRLAGAIKQVDDWRAFFELYQHEVRVTLVSWTKRKDVLGYHPKSEPFNYAGQRLSDPEAPLLDKYLIVIGRSGHQSAETRHRAGRFGRGHSVEVVSYDRLLGLAQRRYASEET